MTTHSSLVVEVNIRRNTKNNALTRLGGKCHLVQIIKIGVQECSLGRKPFAGRNLGELTYLKIRYVPGIINQHLVQKVKSHAVDALLHHLFQIVLGPHRKSGLKHED